MVNVEAALRARVRLFSFHAMSPGPPIKTDSPKEIAFADPNSWSSNVLSRLRAAGTSAAVTTAVACVAAVVVFSIWYPSPFREISGGDELLLLVVAADLVLGPLTTFCIFSRRKTRSELVRDLAIVVTIQIAGLIYGLHAIYIARPVVLALEKNRVRVVRAADLDDKAMEKAPLSLRYVPLWGQLVVAAEDDPADVLLSVQLAMAGLDIGQRPERWLPAEYTATRWISGSQPAGELLRRYPERRGELEKVIAKTGFSTDQVRFLPLIARRTDWVVLISALDGKIVGYAPFDGF